MKRYIRTSFDKTKAVPRSIFPVPPAVLFSPISCHDRITFKQLPRPGLSFSVFPTSYISSKMGSIFSSNKRSKEQLEMALNKVKQIVSSNPVVVFSKTYCGYCKRVKDLLTQVGATYKVIELNEESDGDDIQAALAEWTGQKTVPNVFIGGKHIGGCDSVLEKHKANQLVPLLTAAGAIVDTSAQVSYA